MPRQSKRKSARRRVPQQIDLFADAPMIGGMPAWPRLPTQAALTSLMTRLILNHADETPDRFDGGRSCIWFFASRNPAISLSATSSGAIAHTTAL